MADVKNKTVRIYIDNAPAKVALADLKAKQEGYNKRLDEAKAKQAELTQKIAEAKKKGESYTSLAKDLKEVSGQTAKYTRLIADNEKKQADLQRQLDSGIGPSLKEQASYVSKLYNQYRALGQNTDEAAEALKKYREEAEKLAAMKGREKEVEETQDTGMRSSFLGNLAAEGVSSVLDAFKGGLNAMVGDNLELSDEFADIAKSANLSIDQVGELNESLMKLDTRTKAKDLRELAVGLGTVGEAATADNIKALDQIVVALGDEFGGDAKGITETISVLRNNLDDVKSGNYAEDVSHIGNALNVLGSEGLASAPVVTDIANRIAGVGRTFNLSSGEILGTAATFQELGIEAEKGSTAFVSIMQKMAAEPKNFAVVAGMGIKEFKELVNRDMMAAFVKVSEGAKLAGKDNTTFAKILKELNADGSGAGEVLSKLSTNGQLLHDKISLASDALTNHNSITDEFSKKNDNAAGGAEKLVKWFKELFVGGWITQGISAIVSGLVSLIQPTRTLSDGYKEQGAAVASLEKSTLPLINRYDELNQKATTLGGVTKLSKDEQTELQKAIVAIGNTIPGAITQFDKYGNAIGISSQKAREFIDMQKAVLKEKNRDVLNEQTGVAADLEKQIQANVNKANAILRSARGEIKGEGGDYIKNQIKNGYASQQDLDKFLARQTAFAQSILQKNIALSERLKGVRGYMDELSGGNLKVPEAPKPTETPQPPPELKFDDKAAEKYQNKLEAFLRRIEDFKVQLADTGGDQDQKEIDRIQNKYDDLIKEAKKYVGAVNVEQLKGLRDNAINKLVAEQLKKQAKKEYDESKENLKSYFDERKAAVAKDYSDGKLSQQDHDSELLVLEQQYRDQLVTVGQDYVKSVKDAENELTEFQKSAEAFRTDNKINAIVARQKAEQELLNKIPRETMLSEASAGVAATATNTKRRLDAEMKLMRAQKTVALQELDERHKQERKAIVENTALTAAERAKLLQDSENGVAAQMQEINSSFRQKEQETTLAFYTAMAETALGMFQEIGSLFAMSDQAETNKENAKLAEQQKANQKEKDSLKKKLDAKLITQQEYNKKVAALDDAYNKHAADVKKKQWERQQKADVINAGITGSQAVLSALATKPFVLGLILAGVAALKTKKEIDNIKSTPAPEFGTGGFLNGPSHSSGGMPVLNPVTGKKEAEVEGGEVILSKNTVRNNPDLVGALLHNSMYKQGATLQPQYQVRAYRTLDYPSAMDTVAKSRYYANGGTFLSPATTAPPEASQTVVVSPVPEEVLELLRDLRQIFGKPIPAVVSYSQLKDADDKVNQIVEDATFR